jgi:hypothetical protein
MRAAAAQQRPHAGFELRQVEGLGEVVVGAEIQAAHAVGQRVERGEHQHRHGGLAGPQAAQHLQAVDARQADVQDRQVVDAQRQGPVGLLTVVGDVHRVSGLHQRAAQGVGKDQVVLGKQDSHRHACRRKGRGRCPADRATLGGGGLRGHRLAPHSTDADRSRSCPDPDLFSRPREPTAPGCWRAGPRPQASPTTSCCSTRAACWV